MFLNIFLFISISLTKSHLGLVSDNFVYLKLGCRVKQIYTKLSWSSFYVKTQLTRVEQTTSSTRSQRL